jgi:multidrug efflux pump subunit AcrB
VNDVQGAKLGLAGSLARAFLNSRLTPLAVIASILLGVLAVALTPREEEPQIIVPMVDVMIPLPGASPNEVESQVLTPVERRLWGIAGVEYLYGTARPGLALLTVRFKVNEPLEQSLVKVRQELDAHPEILPSGAMKPLVRLLTIDDVPFLTLALHGGGLPAGALRSLGEEVARELADVPDTAQVRVLGGARRQVRIEPDPSRLRAYGLSIGELPAVLQSAEAQLPAGALLEDGVRVELEAAGFALSAKDLESLVVAQRAGKPVYLRDVATITDGPEPEPAMVLFASRAAPSFEPAVALALSKRAGSNATELSKRVEARIESLRGGLLPRGVEVTVTRDYGETAGEKSNELIEHLLIATLSVIALIGLAMGLRAALVVGVAVPVTLALTLLSTYLMGYTLNRVTLFALIFSIGILVDDAIVVVENVHRHLHLPGRHRSFARTVLDAVDEVGNPTILATFTVIAAILPMAFVRGLMGPYMRPIPMGASMAMLFSLVIAFVVSPWAALRLFRKEEHLPTPDASALHPADPKIAAESWVNRFYRRQMSLLLRSAKARWAFFVLVVLLLGGSMALVAAGAVRVKMLPFDNKSELQVLIDLPAGAAREDALAVGQRLARRLLQETSVRDVQVYAGVASPFTFVGMVRHAFFREEAQQVDVQVNLVPKGERKEQSHAFAVRLRPILQELANPSGARVQLWEIPPGPPVMATMVAEIYGPSQAERERIAQGTLDAFRATEGVVDIDSTLTAAAPKITLRLDREKASLHGVAPATVVQVLSAAGAGMPLGTFHLQSGAEQVPLVLQLPVADRTRLDTLLKLTVPGVRGPVPLSELVVPEEGREARAIFHKNLRPVSYVFGDLAGKIESPVYALAALNEKIGKLRSDRGEEIPIYGLSHPADTERPSIKWDGEWHITLEVFRDLGLAFAAVLVLIYILVVGWFQSFTVPLVILVPIPLSLIGILPAHALAGSFFTATSMIGFIAGAGIIVRNSIILVDFIELKLREGMPLALAVEEAGVVRFRPMLLTAAAVLVGSLVMLADPIFQGLAISLMAGEVAATQLSFMAVPLLYFLLARMGRAAELQREGEAPEGPSLARAPAAAIATIRSAS